MHRHDLGRGNDVELGRVRMFGEFLLDGFSLADQHDLSTEISSGKQCPLDHDFRGMVSAHRVDGDFRHGIEGI